MSRKKNEGKSRREVKPDARYNTVVLSKFINTLMMDGKKSTAEKVVFEALDQVEQRTGEDAFKVFKKAMDNIKPAVEVKSRRVGGANYQVPVEVRPARRQALAMRWLRDHSRSRNEKTMVERLTAEIVEAYNNRGGAVKKKEDTHRMADANKAFSHLQW